MSLPRLNYYSWQIFVGCNEFHCKINSTCHPNAIPMTNQGREGVVKNMKMKHKTVKSSACHSGWKPPFTPSSLPDVSAAHDHESCPCEEILCRPYDYNHRPDSRRWADNDDS